MSDLTIEVSYAYAALGLRPGDPPERARELLADAEAYQFATTQRRELVRRLVYFLEQRSLFGKPDESFASIRKAYHRRAMTLHPDSNHGDTAAIEQLKMFNTAFEIVDSTRREAEEYYRKSPDERQTLEAAAQQDAALERRARQGSVKAEDRHTTPRAKTQRTQTRAAVGVRYFAASVPRYIRNSRLFYLPRAAIIGSRLVQNKSGGLVYDIIMLPENEFMRAKLLLSMATGQTSSVELTMSKMTPAYNPVDAKAVVIPSDVRDPYRYARAFFLQHFKLEAGEE